MTKKIMVVDDDKATLMVVRAVLESANYEVVTAQSGEKCLNSVEKEKPDLILLDVRMPHMSGWDTFRGLKDKGIIDSTKVVMLTVDDNPGGELLEFRDLLSGYILKPFEKDELIRRVEGILG
ncbi:MAG: response regulator [Candidatus Altiarchaeales archaeon]|nr:response regulator [Candidatus Altiarchaeota archaeon]MBU4406184.1 response regulator [Candidatus Altiarchaeota archaeon]MBU4437110.1 response regulator [Candidatus Altiarchaeota archaeon]MCG2783010.1 response regulator [Candidatus Altiarchaeales archaeon]